MKTKMDWQDLYLLFTQLFSLILSVQRAAAVDFCGGRPITGVGTVLEVRADCSVNGLATIEWSSPPGVLYRNQIDYQCFNKTGLETAEPWSDVFVGRRDITVPDNASQCVFYGCYNPRSGFDNYEIAPVHCISGNTVIATLPESIISSSVISTTILSSAVSSITSSSISPTEPLVSSTYHHTAEGNPPMSTRPLQGTYSSASSFATSSTIPILAMDNGKNANGKNTNGIDWYVYVIIGAAVVGFLTVVSFPVLYYCNQKRRHRKRSTYLFPWTQILRKDVPDPVSITRPPSINSDAETILAELWGTVLGTGVTESIKNGADPEVVSQVGTEEEEEEGEEGGAVPEDPLQEDCTTTGSGSVSPEHRDDITEASLQMSSQNSMDGDYVSEDEERSISVEDERNEEAITIAESHDSQVDIELEPTDQSGEATATGGSGLMLASSQSPRLPARSKPACSLGLASPQSPRLPPHSKPAYSPDHIQLKDTGYWELNQLGDDSGNSGYLGPANEVELNIWSLSN